MSQNRDTKVLILTGPGGSGKTTIAKLLEQERGFVRIDGDQLDTEFFPDGDQWLPENAERLRLAQDKILATTKEVFNTHPKIVVDYIIFGLYREFIKKFKVAFGENLEVKVLFPSLEKTVQRDKERLTWTTGIERISQVRSELEALRDMIGSENYIDSSQQTPEETVKMICSENQRQ